MLKQELWQRLPALPGRQPSLLAALQGSLPHAQARGFDNNSFLEWAANGNPWKQQFPGDLACWPRKSKEFHNTFDFTIHNTLG